jgi:hypothetical protein
VYRRWELTELSTIAVPGNANCLTVDVARSLAAYTPTGTLTSFDVHAELLRHQTNLQALKRSLLPELRLLVRFTSRGALTLEDVQSEYPGKSIPELQEILQRLQLQFSIKHWQGLNDSIDERKARKDQYAAQAAARERETYRSAAAPAAGDRNFVRKVGSAFVAYSESGKVLGRFRTRAEADAAAGIL